MPHRSIASLAYLSLLLSTSTTTYGQNKFQFVQRGTKDILAYLELATLPATSSDVVSLTFTQAGDDLLGLGFTYDGAFDDSPSVLLATESDPSRLYSGGLRDTIDPEQSRFVEQTANFKVSFDARSYSIIGVNVEVGGPGIEVLGDFIEVPEPTSLMLFLAAICLATKHMSFR